MTVKARIYNRSSGSLATKEVEWPDFRARLKKAGMVEDEQLPGLWVNDDFILRVVKNADQ